MYKNILVPIAPDETGRAAESMEIARAVCQEGGKITLISVMEVPRGIAAQYIAQHMTDEKGQNALKKEEQRLNEALSAIGSASTKVLIGHPARAILDEAEESGADCVIISSHSPGLSDYFLGSTAARVVRHAQCSVLVLR